VGQFLGDLKVDADVMRDTAGYNILMYGASGGLGPLQVKADRVTGSARDGESISAGWVLHAITVTGTYYQYTNNTTSKTLTVSYLVKAL
jgi:hypothetical protein